MIRSLMTVDLISGPQLPLTAAAGLVGLAGVIIVPPRRAFDPVVLGASVALAAAVVGVVLSHTGALGGTISTRALVVAAAALGVAASGVWGAVRGPRLRRVCGWMCAVSAMAAGALGVNSVYAVTPTVGSLLGFQSLARVELPALVTAPLSDPTRLLDDWTPPSDMPAEGRVGALSDDVRIPSGAFRARDAGVYLPPAALVAAPPRLPLLVFMMGQPGTPDPTLLAPLLDEYARTHRGLAPIVIVVDQLGSLIQDPACVDSSRFGPVETYINDVLPQWVRQHLNVVADPASWTIAGYSNGGACAMLYGARHPDVWGSIVDISGTRAPGSDHATQTIHQIYADDAAAYEANAPEKILAATAPGIYERHLAVLTWGSDDDVFGPDQRHVARAARAAGYTVREHEIAGADHTGAAFTDGVRIALRELGPTFGIDVPSRR